MAPWLNERSRNGGIDEVPLPTARGRLWLCGKHFVGPDPEATLHRTGADAVVCLNEGDELADRYPAYVEWLQASRGGRAVWFPIADLHAPPVAEVRPLLDDLHARLRSGHGLVVSCGAGIGRAGTVAASLLVLDGASLQEALDVLARSRPMAGPQTREQEVFLETWAVTVAPAQPDAPIGEW
jgi:NAD(P)-dependent dehydrogenase (short-subunit alcohol dehydrogenase family)